MTLKYIVENLETVEEAHRGLYVQAENGFRLNVEGVVPREKLDEFRNNNIELNNKLAEFKDIDPKRYTELVKLADRVKGKELLDEGKLEEMVNSRTSAFRQELEAAASEEKARADQLEHQLHSHMIDSSIRQRALSSKVLPTAIDDVMHRARGVFRFVDGQVIPFEGDKIIYGKDGVNPMSVDEWVAGLAKSAPHLFEMPAGGGARGGNGRGQNTANMSSIDKIKSAFAQ